MKNKNLKQKKLLKQNILKNVIDFVFSGFSISKAISKDILRDPKVRKSIIRAEEAIEEARKSIEKYEKMNQDPRYKF